MQRSFQHVAFRLFYSLLALFTFIEKAHSYHVEIPDYRANPGTALKIPIILDEVDGLAHIRIQVNYSQDILTFVSAEAGPVGKMFDFDYRAINGTIVLDFVNAECCNGPGGHLAYLNFTPTQGVTQDLYSELAIARFDFGDDSGLIDLQLSNPATTKSGSIRVSLDQRIDNAGNGLPDQWETIHGLNPLEFRSSDDPDYDGIDLMREFAFGGDPTRYDPPSILPHGSITLLDNKTYLTITFRRRVDSSSGLDYHVFESRDLKLWQELATDSMELSRNYLGNDIELVTIRSSIGHSPYGENESNFMKVVVEKQQ
ncbi:MAG: hypothetical protein AAFX93_18125 [Verrucomicrobiota bacterium]